MSLVNRPKLRKHLSSFRGHIYKRKVKRQSVEMRRGVAPGPVGGAEMRTRADIHPELTLDKIQNPPDARRGVLTSFGSR